MDADLKECKMDIAERINHKDDSSKRTGKHDIKPEIDEVESTKAEMTGIKEENSRLRELVQQIEKDYKSLQTQFMHVFHQKSNQKDFPTTSSNGHHYHLDKNGDDHRERELVSLRLGTSCSSISSKKENYNDPSNIESRKNTTISIDGDKDETVKLGLEYNFEGSSSIKKNMLSESPDKFSSSSLTARNDVDEDENEDAEIRHSSKSMKRERSTDQEDVHGGNEKRARVCVRARCDTPTMNDGCQWRKYGQKTAKGNPCPRSYYRCTVSSSCPVRKQVQRCVEDTSILTTTYEGTHNHPLPLSATAMASTTSAVASMLLSGSSTSQLPSTSAQPMYYVPTASTTQSPTITLDLTTINPSAASGGFSLHSSSSRTTPATSINFSNMGSHLMPTVWNSGGLTYKTLPYDSGRSLQLDKPLTEQNYQNANTLFEKLKQASNQQAITETLTKVITSDPSFQSVIAAAISSMAANGGSAARNNQ